MNILSISSMSSAYCIGNRAASFAYQLSGVQCILINTFYCKGGFSDKPSSFIYIPEPDIIQSQISNVLNDVNITIDYISIGFLGYIENVNAVFQAIKKYNKNNIPIMLDLTFGNNDAMKYYFDYDAVKCIISNIKNADIIKCNAFESEHIQDISCIPNLIITGKIDEQNQPFSIKNTLYCSGVLVEQSHHSMHGNTTIKGAGDVFSALFLSNLIKMQDCKLAFIATSKNIGKFINHYIF